MMKNKRKGKWVSLARTLIIIFVIILFLNALTLFREIKRDLSYAQRAYGLSAMDEAFEEGRYYQVYEYTIRNSLTDEKPYVDTSQYEAFGRWYHAYLLSRMYKDEPAYRQAMAKEKEQISWKKILTVIGSLEKEAE